MESSAGERNWTGYGVPALVALLLGIQFFLGFRGFGQPDGGLLGLLEAPGALLGWGGVVILAVLLGWLIAGLVGRDLFGLRGASGLVVRLVGCVALGLALSGVFGLLGGRAGGGEVGAGIGDLLGSALGNVPAILVLILMAVPALLLSISPFFSTGPKVARPGAGVSLDALADLEPKPGLYEGGTTHQPKPLYPERRFDESGNEIPMTFDARDVGQVRYADEGPDPEEATRTQKPEPVPAPDAEDLADGVRFADDDDAEGDEGAPSKPEPVEADDGRIPLGNGVRYVDEEDGDEEADEDGEEEEHEDVEEGEEEIPEPEEPEAAPPPRPVVPAVTPRPVTTPPPPAVRAADALDQLQDEDEGARYRAKLEDSGIFDEPPLPAPRPTPGAEEKPPSTKKKATKKKAARARKKPAATKKKTPAKKKASPKKKTPAKKKAATAGKQAAAKKKPATAKKATSTKKKKTAKAKKTAPAGRQAAAKKKAAPKKKGKAASAAAPEPVEGAPRRKGATTTVARDEIYDKAVAVAMERSAASSVLLSRRLGIGYAQARSLIELLVADGILGEMTPSGSRPVLVTEEEWEERAGEGRPD